MDGGRNPDPPEAESTEIPWDGWKSAGTLRPTIVTSKPSSTSVLASRRTRVSLATDVATSMSTVLRLFWVVTRDKDSAYQ